MLTSPARAQTGALAGLDACVTNAMALWGVPGLALAIVKDDAVAYVKGYGVCSAGGSEPVNEQTIFAIGSLSKAFTATAVGALVQDGKAAWDDRVVDYLPGLRFFDDTVTSDIRIRDLLAMRSGLSAISDQLWYNSDYNRDEVMKRLPLVPADPAGFRNYAYRNCNYLIAAQVMPVVANITWDDLVTGRIFQPLGMARSVSRHSDYSRFDNVASPHIITTNKSQTIIPCRNIDNLAPCGSILSCATDMAAWLRMNLAGGCHEGRQIIDSNILCAVQSPQVASDTNGNYYCMGWGSSMYRGISIRSHAGCVDGMCAIAYLAPGLHLGIVIMANAEFAGGVYVSITSSLANRILDSYLGADPYDWNAVYYPYDCSQLAAIDEYWRRENEQHVPGTTPSLPLDAYAGDYADPLYGPVQVEIENGRMVFHQSSKAIADLEHWHYDTFLATYRDIGNQKRLGQFWIVFQFSPGGQITNMTDGFFNYLPVAGVPDASAVPGDYDGDARFDPTVFHESSGLWFSRLSSAYYACGSAYFSNTNAAPVSGDFDGDGRHDPALRAYDSGLWLFRLSSANYAFFSMPFLTGSLYRAFSPDFDGDRLSDPALYDPETGNWIVRVSGQNHAATLLPGFGAWPCLPVASDYDGDRLADPAIYNQINGTWRIMLSSFNYTEYQTVLGGCGYIAVPSDFNGDGKAEPAVYHALTGVWTILLDPASGVGANITGGGLGFEPAPGDYDADGRADFALYRWNTGHWTARLSASGYGKVDWQ